MCCWNKTMSAYICGHFLDKGCSLLPSEETLTSLFTTTTTTTTDPGRMPPLMTTEGQPTWAARQQVWTRLVAPIPLLAVCLVLINLAAIWRYRKRHLSTAFITTPDSLDNKLLSPPMSMYTSMPDDPITNYLPPPPGCEVFTSPLAHDDGLLFGILNSGHLAAKADRELRALQREASPSEKGGPWRRNSYPLQQFKFDSADVLDQTSGDLEAIRHDSLVQFADPDLNGIWRRRILEFENR